MTKSSVVIVLCVVISTAMPESLFAAQGGNGNGQGQGSGQGSGTTGQGQGQTNGWNNTNGNNTNNGNTNNGNSGNNGNNGNGNGNNGVRRRPVQNIQNYEPSTIGSGGWYYHNNPASTEYGNINVNCVHSDTKGEIWASY